jgi:DNA-directed RNA polymerase subunit M/transcription elongation factor TFIIS
MYYLKLKDTDSNNLLYYCRNCGDEKDMDDTNITVLKTNINNITETYSNMVNEYTKYDPTLPRTSSIKCPNVDCISNTDNSTKNKILYIRYDDVNIKYIYICTNCDTNWKTASS